MNESWVEIVGYLASVLIVLGFIPKDVLKIRLINLAGCICFVIYGIYRGMLWPIIIPNAIICFIQVYYLLQKKVKSRLYDHFFQNLYLCIKHFNNDNSRKTEGFSR